MMTDHPSSATTIVVLCRPSEEEVEEEEEGWTITTFDYGVSAVFDLECPKSRFLVFIICHHRVGMI